MQISKQTFAVAALLTAVCAGVYAQTPTTAPSKPGDKTDTTQIQHLRAARKSLNQAKDAFERDPADTANHRKEILEGIDKAITAVDAEIDELKKLQK